MFSTEIPAFNFMIYPICKLGFRAVGCEVDVHNMCLWEVLSVQESEFSNFNYVIIRNGMEDIVGRLLNVCN